jgi:hypothetical protein
VPAGVRVVAILDRAPVAPFGSLLAGRHAATERRWFNQVGDRSSFLAALAHDRGHRFALVELDPARYLAASVASFRGDDAPMRLILMATPRKA